MKTVDCIQGSDAWLAARLGSLGASCLHEIVALTKSGFSASRANRMATMVVERLTGSSQDAYQTPAMLYGTETEPEARAAYAFLQNVDVAQVGLVRHPSIDRSHASPDGLVGNNGLLEIKCPQPAAHLALLLGKPIPDKYIVQMLWQMTCCGRDWCDFASYCPAFPHDMRLFVHRVGRDAERIAELESAVRVFLGEIDETVAKLTSLYRIQQAAE